MVLMREFALGKLITSLRIGMLVDEVDGCDSIGKERPLCVQIITAIVT